MHIKLNSYKLRYLSKNVWFLVYIKYNANLESKKVSALSCVVTVHTVGLNCKNQVNPVPTDFYKNTWKKQVMIQQKAKYNVK